MVMTKLQFPWIRPEISVHECKSSSSGMNTAFVRFKRLSQNPRCSSTRIWTATHRTSARVVMEQAVQQQEDYSQWSNERLVQRVTELERHLKDENAR